jgi:hypothetical protein
LAVARAALISMLAIATVRPARSAVIVTSP